MIMTIPKLRRKFDWKCFFLMKYTENMEKKIYITSHCDCLLTFLDKY